MPRKKTPTVDELLQPQHSGVSAIPVEVPPLPAPVALEFHYRYHDGLSNRVWRSDWAGDAFEIIDIPSFNRFRIMLKKFGVSMVFHDLEED